MIGAMKVATDTPCLRCRSYCSDFSRETAQPTMLCSKTPNDFTQNQQCLCADKVKPCLKGMWHKKVFLVALKISRSVVLRLFPCKCHVSVDVWEKRITTAAGAAAAAQTEDRCKKEVDGCCYKQLLTCHRGQSVDLGYAVDLFLSTIDMRMCVNMIWVKSASLYKREGFLC